MKRDFARTKHPGIYAGTLPGLKPDRYKVYYRLSGCGQRTRTFLKLKDALAFQGKVRDPNERRMLRDLEAGKVALADYLPTYMGAKRRWRESTRERMGYAARPILDSRLARLQLLNITRSSFGSGRYPTRQRRRAQLLVRSSPASRPPAPLRAGPRSPDPGVRGPARR